jgi:2-dehydro-3-deoxyphosphogluconate aldolase / (4S)-4-hydroxy-2-oxoglutarate aldolase
VSRESRCEDPADLADTGVMAILRGRSARHVLPAAAVLARSGVRCLELTLTTPDGLATVRRLTRELGNDATVGAGTVTSEDEALMAIDAGARFLVSPVVDHAVLAVAGEAEVPCYPGAWTATEVLDAWRAQATAVKVFPASIGGPDHLRHLRGPLPQVRLIPTGGVEIADAGEYIRAGATAVGVGGPLLRDALDGGDLDELARRAEDLLADVARARAARA